LTALNRRARLERQSIAEKQKSGQACPMSNHVPPHGVERRREIGRFEAPERVEKNFLAKIACNPLISLVLDERIQGNPRKSNVQNPGFS
jgi:hypothetical protein